MVAISTLGIHNSRNSRLLTPEVIQVKNKSQGKVTCKTDNISDKQQTKIDMLDCIAQNGRLYSSPDSNKHDNARSSHF
ncbi:hypothetical protein FRC03_007022, partial [Tulasnella sp. 419]